MGAPGRTNALAFRYFVADLERLLSARPHAEDGAVQRFHPCTHARRPAKEPCLAHISGDREDRHGCGYSHPAETRVSHLRKLALPGQQRAAIALAVFRLATAADAVVKVRLHQ